MIITEEQTNQAGQIIRDHLKDGSKYRLPVRKVWTKLAYDLDDDPFFNVWVIYDENLDALDIPLLNNLSAELFMELRAAGIHAIPALSYVPESEAGQLEHLWTR